MKNIGSLCLLSAFLLCFVVTSVAECAAVADPGLMSRNVSEASMKNFAMTLAQGLGEKVKIVQVEGYEQLDEFLNRYAVMDLALIENNALRSRMGDYIFLGAVDKAETIVLVGRQGISAELTKKVLNTLKKEKNLLLAEPKAPQKENKTKKAEKKQTAQKPKSQQKQKEPVKSKTAKPKDFVQIVVLAYQKYLDREPDPGGHEYWVGQLTSGAVTEKQFEAHLCKASNKADCK